MQIQLLQSIALVPSYLATPTVAVAFALVATRAINVSVCLLTPFVLENSITPNRSWTERVKELPGYGFLFESRQSSASSDQ